MIRLTGCRRRARSLANRSFEQVELEIAYPEKGHELACTGDTDTKRGLFGNADLAQMQPGGGNLAICSESETMRSTAASAT